MELLNSFTEIILYAPNWTNGIMERCKKISHILTSELLAKISLQGGLVSVDYEKKGNFRSKGNFQFQARK